MQNEPLTGARKPEQTDGPLGGLQISNAVSDLAKYAVPRYATTAARDTAYASFVTGGGAMSDGMVAVAGGIIYRYTTASGGSWRVVWTDYTGKRAPFTTTTKVATDTALVTLSIPAVPAASRLILVASGKTGFDDTAQTSSWEFDTIPGTATNVAQDSVEQINVAASGWSALTHTLSMDLPASTSAAPRLVLRSSGPVYNRGSVIWHRSPIN